MQACEVKKLSNYALLKLFEYECYIRASNLCITFNGRVESELLKRLGISAPVNSDD